ncbi:MAG TPA: porin family protein [Prolixibacteraceae bacterium]|nr:porin family protein [Prolixibacteraceae bacterium]
MKNFGTLLIFALMLTMTSEGYSQIFGVKGGLNLANMQAKDDIGNLDTKMITGFNLGATAEFPLSKMFSFETGLQLSTKGTKRTESSPNGIDTDYKAQLTYLDIPLTAKATFDVSGVKLYGVFGPYIGIGLGGQTYEDGEGTKIKWGSYQGTGELDFDDKGNPIWDDSDDFKRLDYGLIIGAGVEIKAIQIGLTYGLGLANISPDTSDGTKVSNRVLGISVGYKFGKK